MNYDELYQQFIGKGKVQAISINKKNGGWALKFKEGKKFDEIESDDRESLEKLLIEFGGKNPETCTAPDKFLTIDGTWDAETINMLGHRISKAKFSGQRLLRNDAHPITIPDDCGYQTIMDSKKKTGNGVVNLRLVDREMIDFTMAFKKPDEFDNLCKFLFNNEQLKRLKWHIMLLGTESRETKDQCVWKRLKAGDGTKRMVLELIGLNGNHYTECIRQDLFNAAGDMFYNPCQRITVKKKKEQTMEICMFAAEDGKIDMTKYEAATA